jgi:hypothetical protein
MNWRNDGGEICDCLDYVSLHYGNGNTAASNV